MQFRFSMLALALMGVTSAYAAQPINLNHQPISILQSLQAQSTFTQISSDVDFNQTKHVRMQQMVQGHPVWGGDFVVHTQKNKLAPTMNGVIYQGINADLSSAPAYVFNTAQANKALQHAAQLYQKKSGVRQSITDTKTKLMVFVDKNNLAHWVYHVNFVTQEKNGMPAKPNYLLDAVTLTVYKEWNNIQTESNDNVQAGGFGGNEKVGKIAYDGSGEYQSLPMQRDASKKICYLQNENVTVLDAAENDTVAKFNCDAKDSKHGDIYWNADGDAVNGGFSPRNDALFIGDVVRNMYQDWYGVPPLVENGKPMVLTMRVHLRQYDNAFWDGHMMSFGDGYEMFYPLVSLGVGAHEISHGFTEQHSNLVYQGQSGGLNEAFSDMAAQAAEFYAVHHNTWQIGPEIYKEKDKALRYMDDPTKDGTSIGNMKDYSDELDVHYTSGIFNKIFYLMGTASGWDTKKAFNVMVKANQNYWTSSTSFAEAACGVVKATQDYKYDTTAVKNAMDQVGLDISQCN